jgi:arsenite methyltransferase
MADQLLESVQSKYGSRCQQHALEQDAGVKAVAEAFGYSPDQLLLFGSAK